MMAKKAVILGIDGLDYSLTNKLLRQGVLPNIKKLGEQGNFNKLETTVPPQSPVAWSSLVTGKQPKDHGVWDFLVRDKSSYLLYPVFSPMNKGSALRAEPFWRKTAKVGIETEVLFLPVTFPAEGLKGKMITGMGTPDILGTEGTMYVLTTDEQLLRGKRGRRVRLEKQGESYHGGIPGPRYKTFRGVEVAKLPVEVRKVDKGVEVRAGGRKVQLEVGEFSGWMELEFKLGALRKIRGRGRWFLKSIEPEVVIHLSPINIEPGREIFKICYPGGFAKELENEYGEFATLGLPHDTWALQEGIFREEDFLTQAEVIMKRRKEILLGELEKFDQGLWVGYLGTLDSVQHMFWKAMEEKGEFGEVVGEYYKKMDEVVGEVLGLVDKDTTVVVMSDHGFGSFDWEVNLNSWLKEEGFLVLEGETGGELYEGVDWGKTRAFAAGFNSIYLNRVGREAKGVVKDGEVEDLSRGVKTKLMKLVSRGNQVVKNAYTRQDLGVVKNSEGPDLIVGYKKGFRSSWETAVGATPKELIKRRAGKWGGDHLFDATEVPGVVVSNQKPGLKDPKIWEIMPWVLRGIV
jgi:predicted AlkP superfamily phosphohydrolase/phosphomutase